MNKYLIFRTDRIGDYLLTAVLIASIKENDPTANITIIASKKNYDYIRNHNLSDEVFLLKENFFERCKLIIKLIKEKFYAIILHDNKKRSRFISFFLKSKNKIFPQDDLNLSHFEIIQEILKQLNLNFHAASLDILKDKQRGNFNIKNYILLHFDEKWIYKNYIKKFINIEPTPDQLANFFDKIMVKTNKNLVITSGLKMPALLNNALKKNLNKNIFFFKDLNFFKLEEVIINSDIMISCHGSVSHVASAKNIKQIDIIDKSYSYSRWTHHFRNYNSIFRTSFDELSRRIIDKL